MNKKEELAREYSYNVIGVDYIGAVAVEYAYKAGWDACIKHLKQALDDKEILAKLAERINRSKPMPKEFSKIIDEEFWNLI